LITFEEIAAAREALAGVAVRTPLLSSPLLEERTGARVFFKAENLQRTGSFKIRGAFHRLQRLSGEEARRGVVAFSSGNHAQAVACAARLLRIPATIVMPADAPVAKLEGTRAHGARLRLYDRRTESREDIAAGIAAATGAVLVRPYDDLDVIRGQGTCGLEIAEQAAAEGVVLDELWVPASGGGLVAGIGVAIAARSPATRLFTVEPAGFDDHRASLERGERSGVPTAASATTSLCDGLLAPEPGVLTWEINRGRLAGGLVASDAEVKRAVAFAFRHLKLVLEPSGAIALAAFLAGAREVRGRSIGLVLSGGNVDPAVVLDCLERSPEG
jgi:threonine dehydratase